MHNDRFQSPIKTTTKGFINSLSFLPSPKKRSNKRRQQKVHFLFSHLLKQQQNVRLFYDKPWEGIPAEHPSPFSTKILVDWATFTFFPWCFTQTRKEKSSRKNNWPFLGPKKRALSDWRPFRTQLPFFQRSYKTVFAVLFWCFSPRRIVEVTFEPHISQAVRRILCFICVSFAFKCVSFAFKCVSFAFKCVSFAFKCV